MGEIELGFLAEQGRVIAITGTNGKTTTTTLTGEIMKAHFGKNKTFVVGNIGNPYTLEADKTSKDSVTVGEISSFQLGRPYIHSSPVVSADPEYHTGSPEQTSYHGGLCGSQGSSGFPPDKK